MLFYSRKQSKEQVAAEDKSSLQKPAQGDVCSYLLGGGRDGFPFVKRLLHLLKICEVRTSSHPKMYQISQLMSTPVASKYSAQSEKEYAVEPSPRCILPSSVCDFLDGDSPFEGLSGDPPTGSPVTCRRSPRLLTNGYYIWTEDSFLCDEGGNITLSPSQTRVLYKENLVRIFRKKRRIRRSFSSLFNLSASDSWLHESIFDDVDSSPSEDVWLEGVRRLETNYCKENGGDFDCSLTNDWESQKLNAESVKASFAGPVASQRPRENSCGSSPQSQWTASERFQEDTLDHPKTSLLREVFFQAILLAACLIISACARTLPMGQAWMNLRTIL
ncbi:transmembrane protein 71 isoform X2 [Odocoileus virginianus]|uniref:Transmembrane protein 71 isoform X2 n=1 Tax=Odocoileus virginianus TaxID=9874 RepID=A0ABM4IZ44_ODOVR